jgi:hypothetical protein
MTITSNILRRDYTANGVNTSYAFDFPIFYESNATPKFSLEVIVADTTGAETTKIETTDYTITYNTTDYVNGVINQGNVVFNTAPANNYTISLLRKVNFTQNNDITTSGSDALPGTALEGSLDKLTLMLLEQKESLNRVFKLPKSSLLNNIEFPIGTSQANQVITVNNDGDNLTTKDLADVGLAPVSTYIKTLLDDTTASQARTTLNAQQLNANLTAFSGLTGASNKLPYFTGSGAMALQDRLATTTTQGVAYLNNPITIANNTTNPNTQMDIGAGNVDYDNGSGQLLCQAMTKTLQSSGSWTAGTNQNGLDTGARANSTLYHIFKIVKNSDNTSDILYSLSRTAPTVPDGYTLVAWIGSIRTDGSGNIDQSYIALRTRFGQLVRFQTGAVASGSTVIPWDDTIPQNTEGNEFMTLPIIPLSSKSKLNIEVQATLSTEIAGGTIVFGALFQDSIANAISATWSHVSSGPIANPLRIKHLMQSGTTSSTTFKFRAGPESSTLTTLNGRSGARRLGGVANSYIEITEIL